MCETNATNKVVLYGCSEPGYIEYKYLLSAQPNTDYVFCDTIKSQDTFHNIPVISLTELYAMDRQTTDIYVYEDTETVYEKKERVTLAGFSNVYPCTPGMENYYNIIWKVPNIQPELAELFEELYIFIYCNESQARLKRPHDRIGILENITKISDVYNMMTDQESKLTFCDILRYRVSGDATFLKRRVVLPQYFLNDIFEFTDKEVFVDGGAAQGDTIISFSEFVGDKYNKIYAFEAKNTYCIGMEALFNDDRIHLIKKGLHSHDGTLYFYENEHGSFVSETVVTDSKIDVTSIDSSINDDVTFIKMDIEGSEINALEGAKNTIQRCKPKLAICSYHLENDLWEVPLKIKEILPEYKIYMRHHYDIMDEETVCYAKI